MLFIIKKTLKAKVPVSEYLDLFPALQLIIVTVLFITKWNFAVYYKFVLLHYIFLYILYFIW